MTKQDIFDKVWQHFIVEGHPPGLSKHTETGCSYNGPDGPCAVGLFLSPETGTALDEASPDIIDVIDYAQDRLNGNLEYWSDSHDFDTFEKMLDNEVKLLATHGQFLTALQLAHDNTVKEDLLPFRERFAELLRGLAEGHGLKVPA